MTTLTLAAGSPTSTKATGNGISYGGTVAVAFCSRWHPKVDVLAAANEDGTISLFHVIPGSPSPSLQMSANPIFAGGPGHPPSSIAFSPNDNLFVVADPIGQRLWVFETGEYSLKPVTGSPFSINATPRSLAFQPKYGGPGDLLAVATGQGKVLTFVVSAAGLQPWAPPVAAPGALSAAFSPSGHWLATGNADFSGNGNNNISVFAVGASVLKPLTASPFPIPQPYIPVPPGLMFSSPTTPSSAGLGPWPAATSVVFHPTSDSEMAVVLFAYFAGLLGLQPSGAPTVLVYLPTAPAAILPDYEFWDPPFPGLCPTASAFSPDGKVLAIGNAPTGDLPPTPAIVSLFTVQATGLKEVLGPTFFETKDGFTVTSLAFNKSGNLLATANYYSRIQVASA